MDKSQERGLIWVAVGAALWGTDTLLRRPLTAELSSTQIVLNEHLILTAVLLPGLLRGWSRWRALRPSQWAAVIAIAWGGSAFGTVCFTEAVRIGNPSTAVLLQKIQPLFAGLLARLILRELLGPRFWVALVFALAGGYLVSFGGQFPPPSLRLAGGLAPLLALAAAALWGACTVLGRLALRGLSFRDLTALRIASATPLLLALVWVRSEGVAFRLAPHQAISLVLMALIPGLAALLTYYYGLRHSRASLAAVAELTFPATATLLNWMFLKARLTPAQFAGFALIWGVVFYLQRRRP